ncbi:hypothetical protein RhiirA4_478701, partial [Rhizophagus irregularis]
IDSFNNLPNYNIFLDVSTKSITRPYGKLIPHYQNIKTLTKIKAHSGNNFNDIADALAKSGRFELSATSIAHNHIPTQTASTLLWDDKIPLDKDNFQATKRNMINWALTAKWLNHNTYGPSTSTSHSKDVTWKIKTSTNTLSTLDILN